MTIIWMMITFVIRFWSVVCTLVLLYESEKVGSVAILWHKRQIRIIIIIIIVILFMYLAIVYEREKKFPNSWNLVHRWCLIQRCSLAVVPLNKHNFPFSRARFVCLFYFHPSFYSLFCACVKICCKWNAVIMAPADLLYWTNVGYLFSPMFFNRLFISLIFRMWILDPFLDQDGILFAFFYLYLALMIRYVSHSFAFAHLNKLV